MMAKKPRIIIFLKFTVNLLRTTGSYILLFTALIIAIILALGRKVITGQPSTPDFIRTVLNG